MRIVSVDPGACSGVAVWEGSALVECYEAKPFFRVPSCDLLVIEKPMIYPRSPVPPNDIVQLALCVGAAMQSAHEQGIEFVHYAPTTWKGQTPKQVHHARILKSLDEASRQVVEQAIRGVAKTKAHNVLDAVGLGLFHITGRKL